MKIVGLITEYNPFHNGHLYHLEKAKEVTGADACVAVMSGDFVQRGLPAMCDKYARAKAALFSGVDAIFELPTYFATSSAERFAKGAVDLLTGLGVDEIVYGCEGICIDKNVDACLKDGIDACYAKNNFKKLAEILCDEPEEYKTHLKKYLSDGLNFPAARQKAVAEIDENLASLLSKPNNILGIEYEKEILRGGCGIKTHQILRNDEGYFESGSAIRKALMEGSDKNLKSLLPDAMIENLKYTCEIEDFSDLIFYKLSELSCVDLENYYEVTSEIASRIKKYEREALGSVEKLVEHASAKNITSAAIRRALIHILLGIKKSDEQMLYARLLGFNKNSSVMSEIKNRVSKDTKSSLSKDTKSRASINIVTKFADADKNLVKIDQHATEVYNQMVKRKYNIDILDEYHAGVIIF